jgi:hypothetical protein
LKLLGQLHKTTSPSNKIFSITNIFKGCKITDFTRPIEFGTTTNKVATRNPVEFSPRNDYILLVATRQNTLYPTILFSLKKKHSASKIGVNGTARQHGTGEAHRHQSTQVRCDTRSCVDLHRIVTRQSERINSTLLDEGTRPTSQDFFHLPEWTTQRNTTERLVYL